MSDAVSRAVLITGCSSGIGRATAERLARAGHTVYATARSPAALPELEKLGCRTLALDVCDEDSRQRAVDAVVRAEGAVGVLVNNAGYGSEGAVEEVPLDEVRRQFETNVFGLVRMCQLALPGMRRQRFGRIVNLSSMGGRLTLPGGGFYHATKYAVEALSDVLRYEVQPFGVDVVLIEPGLILTEFGNTAIARLEASGAAGSAYAEYREGIKQQIHEAYVGRAALLAGRPEAVARAVERAITARRPRTRYPVTAAARFMLALRRWLPDRAFDALLRAQFPVPRA